MRAMQIIDGGASHGKRACPTRSPNRQGEEVCCGFEAAGVCPSDVIWETGTVFDLGTAKQILARHRAAVHLPFHEGHRDARRGGRARPQAAGVKVW